MVFILGVIFCFCEYETHGWTKKVKYIQRQS